MKILKGNRSKGFEHVLSAGIAGMSYHKVRVTPETTPGITEPQDIFVLIFDAGDDELIQIQLSEEEAIMFQMALKTEGSWIYPE